MSFVTLAVRDVAATRAFYLDGLGWSPVFDDGHEVVMFRVADRVILSFWDRAAFAAEVGAEPATGTPPITLAHNVIDKTSVDRVLATARAAGAVVSEPADRVWGGYSGYFTDPDGVPWEICWNPDEVGQLVVPEVSSIG
ncbi:VOC family protein [Calidifontibacter terrae]